jgi:hypothetical protein
MDARRIARALMDDTFACPAAILVALVDEPRLTVLRQDIAHLGTLERHGCLLAGKVTDSPFKRETTRGSDHVCLKNFPPDGSKTASPCHFQFQRLHRIMVLRLAIA